MKNNRFRYLRRAVATVATLALIPLAAQAEENAPAPASASSAPAPAGASTGETAEALAKRSQNPVASLISVPIQSNVNFGVGPDNDTQYINLIQPVIPMSLTEDWNWIHRGIIPVPVYQPAGQTWGLGDIQYEGFLSPAHPGKLIWGVGPYLNFPTATDGVLGSGKWSAGPAVVLLAMPGHWVFGLLTTQLWSFAGEGGREDVNLTALQYFINYNIPDSGGWYLTATPPAMTFNWQADSSNRTTIPVSAGVGRVFKIGKQHVNARIQGVWFADKPTGGPEWGVQFQFTFLFPQK